MRQGLRFCSSDAEEEIGLEELLLRHALGLPGAMRSRSSRFGSHDDSSAAEWGFRECRGRGPARLIPGITSLESQRAWHDYIAAGRKDQAILVSCLRGAIRRQQRRRAARCAHAQLKFTLTARLPVEHLKAEDCPDNSERIPAEFCGRGVCGVSFCLGGHVAFGNFAPSPKKNCSISLP